MQIGDKVLVPRTGGGTSEGEVIEVYTDVWIQNTQAGRVKIMQGGLI